MCLCVFLIILLANFMFYRGIKSSLKEVEQEVDSRISCMEGKIDEIYTLVYKLGDVLNDIKKKTCGELGGKKVVDNRSKAAYAREYRKRKAEEKLLKKLEKPISRSERMKAYWEERKANAVLEQHRTEDKPEQ